MSTVDNLDEVDRRFLAVLAEGDVAHIVNRPSRVADDFDRMVHGRPTAAEEEILLAEQQARAQDDVDLITQTATRLGVTPSALFGAPVTRKLLAQTDRLEKRQAETDRLARSGLPASVLFDQLTRNGPEVYRAATMAARPIETAEPDDRRERLRAMRERFAQQGLRFD